MNLPPIEKRMQTLLEMTAEVIQRCTACDTVLYFVRHRSGKIAPYTAEGVNHFINCPRAHEFRRGKVRSIQQ